jgi:hypothetical protein
VITRYRRRWWKFFAGLFLAICAYFLLKVFVSAALARTFVALIALTGLALQFCRFLSSGRLSAGPILNVKKLTAEKLRVKVDQISDAAVQEYDRLSTRSLLRGLLIFAAVSCLADWVWPNSILEVLALGVFYGIGMLAWPVGNR